MYDTTSVFNVLAADDTERRVASRRALALAHTRVENHLGAFLRQANSAEEFNARFAACQEEFEGYVRTAAEEHGHEHPEYIARSLHDHYVREAMTKEAPGHKHRPEWDAKRNRQYEHVLEETGDEEEAARVVNKTRRKHHELKDSGFAPPQQQMGTTPEQAIQGMPPQVPPPTTPQQMQQMGPQQQMPQPLQPQDLGQQQPPMGQPNVPGSMDPFLSKREWTPFLGSKIAGPPGLPTDRDALNTGWLNQQTPGWRQNRPALPIADPYAGRDFAAEGQQMFGDPRYHPDHYQICQNCGADHADPSGICPHCGQPPMQVAAGFNGAEDIPAPVGTSPKAMRGVDPRIPAIPPEQMAQMAQQHGMDQPAQVGTSPEAVRGGPLGTRVPAEVDPYMDPYAGAEWDDQFTEPRYDNLDVEPPRFASNMVTCPECGGSKKTANGGECPKCKGRGRVADFGPSILDQLEASVHVAESGHGNTDLGEPEPKMDKRKWTPQTVGDPDPDSKRWPTKRKDVIEPMEVRNDKPLSEIGEQTTERQDLPTAGDDFLAPNKIGPAPHTKTWSDGDQADAVTRTVLD